MPVEIRELVIKATVAQQGNEAAAASQNAANNAVPAEEQIVKICVEKVLEILKDKHGR